MKEKSIQIQSVIYNNEKESLYKAIRSLDNAIRVNKSRGNEIGDATLCYGDASPQPVLDEKDIKNIEENLCKYIRFKYIFFGFNSGSAKGHNLLGEDCKSEYMMIMNPDIIVSPHFFENIMEPFNDEKTGIAEARQTPVEHQKEYNIKTGETDWATTACTVFKTEIFRELKGFDNETFFLYCDDVDFSWRVRLLGLKIIYQPLAPVFHAKRLSVNGSWQPTEAEKYYSLEAALLMAHKWSYPEKVKEILNNLKHGGELEKKVLNEYETRKNNGKLPDPIDSNHKVGKFYGDYYAKNRFVL